MLESWIMDFRYAWRRLLSRPTYAVLAVLTLALGSGGTAAIFSVVRALLLDPLPIAREEQVGIFWFGGSWNEREFATLRGQFPGFQRVAAYRQSDMTLERGDGWARREMLVDIFVDRRTRKQVSSLKERSPPRTQRTPGNFNSRTQVGPRTLRQ